MTQNKTFYEGSDLEMVGEFNNYNTWIFEHLSDYLGKNILEVGAGNGNISAFILKNFEVNNFFGVEPSNLFEQLQNRLKEYENDKTKIKTFLGNLLENKTNLKTEKIDTIIYSNVLEHVPDDQLELKLAYDLLEDNGHILTFSPALPILMSKFDKSIGHYRRYTKKEIEDKMKNANFEIVKSYYFDFVGSFLWFLNYTLLGEEKVNPKKGEFFDKFLVPIIKNEPNKLLPFGKNVLCVGKKVTFDK
jgi:SAM-dependent methyltransferase